MTKYQWISILGVWVMAFLFLGFPNRLDEGIAVLTGLIIIAISYRIGVQVRAQAEASRKDTTPVPPAPSESENIPQ